MYPISLSTSQELRGRLTAAVSVNPSFLCSYADTNPEQVLSNIGTLNGTTPVALAVAPSAGRRIIRQLLIQNTNTASVTVVLSINSTDFYRVSLAQNETLTLNGVYDDTGALKAGVVGPQGPQGPQGPPGTPAPTELEESAQTGNYTLQLSDALKFVTINSSSSSTVTIPPNSSTAFPLGTQILVGRKGTGSVTISPSSGVTLNGGNSPIALGAQWAGVATLWKYGTNDWWIFGGLN